jgi:hypothetical protein
MNRYIYIVYIYIYTSCASVSNFVAHNHGVPRNESKSSAGKFHHKINRYHDRLPNVLDHVVGYSLGPSYSRASYRSSAPSRVLQNLFGDPCSNAK